MTEQPTHPQPVLWNWAQHHHERQRAEAIAANLPGYEQQVTDAQKLLEELKAEYEHRAAEAHTVIAQARADYATQGREHKLASDNAAMLFRIVQRECADLGLELPPVPEQVPLRPTEALPAADGHATRPQALPAAVPAGVVPVWQEPPAQGDGWFPPYDIAAGRPADHEGDPPGEMPTRDIVPGDPYAIPANRIGDPEAERAARDDRQAGDAAPSGTFQLGSEETSDEDA